jgi:hypothetical protein
MRKIYLTIFLECICGVAFGQTDSLRQDSIREKAPWNRIEPKPTRAIYIYPVNEDAAWLYLKNGGFGLLRIFPVRVIGVFAVEDDGFRFIPAKEAPKEMMTQKFFDRFYRYNSLVKAVFIPYSEMKSVRFYDGFIIRTNNGKKFHFMCKRAKTVGREIRSRLKTSKPDK